MHADFRCQYKLIDWLLKTKSNVWIKSSGTF